MNLIDSKLSNDIITETATAFDELLNASTVYSHVASEESLIKVLYV